MSLQLKVKITKDILRASKMCGWTHDSEEKVGQNCAIAVSIREIFPLCSVGRENLYFFLYPDSRDVFAISPLTPETRSFIDQFDTSSPEERVKLPETEVEISIPDTVIDLMNIDNVKELISCSELIEIVE